MKLTLRMLRKQCVVILLVLCILPSVALADLATPPRRLHRVGFEILKKSSAEKGRAQTSAGQEGDNAPLTEAEEKELQKQIAELKEIFGGKQEIKLGNGKTVTYEDVARDLRKNFRKMKAFGDQKDRDETHSAEGWKYANQVSAAERTVITAKIASVKDELQVRFDAEYAKMSEAGKLERIGLFTGEYEYRRERVKREMAERNALTVVRSILEQDERLRECCEGVPIEWLAQAMKCPAPSIDEEAVKNAFRDWSTQRMPNGLNDMERKAVFRWQFVVVEKEKRPWRDLVIDKNGEPTAEIRRRQDLVGIFPRRARRGTSTTVRTKGFEDFEPEKVGAVEFVETWHEKAVAAGMSPTDEDEEVLARARASKKPWAGNPNISIGKELWRRKVKIHGTVSKQELAEARSTLLGGLGMSEATMFDLEFDEPDDGTLKGALEVFAGDGVHALLIRGDGRTGLDVANLTKIRSPHALELHNCKVAHGACLSAWQEFESFSAKNSDLGDLAFLSGCAALTEVKLEGCSLSGLENLWASEHLRELCVANSKNVVDLATVKKLEKLMMLDITGCRVTNFEAIKGHPSLAILKMEHVKGGVDSLSILLENPKLRTVEYLKDDFAPSAYAEFARANRRKRHGENSEWLLKGAVEDRDLPEIRQLCETNVKTDDALSDFTIASEQDTEIFRLLVPKASEYALTRQLDRLVESFGYGHSFDKPSFVPTNRVELVSMLIKHGAKPGDAMEKMAHPAETDLEMFKILLEKTSKKVLGELLEKNIKSFGNDGSGNRDTNHPADRLVVVRLLLKHGADPNARNFFGDTPLGNAIKYDGDMRLVRLLLDNGADAAALYPKMELFREFYQGHKQLWGTNRYELVELLLAHGFDANAKGRFGKTPLGELVFFGDHEGYDLKMAELLLKHGADSNAKQGENLGSAIDMAYGRPGAKELVELFEKHGGVVSEDAKKKAEAFRNGRSGKSPRDGEGEPMFRRRSRRHGGHDGIGERIHEEMERFDEEMRKCTDPEERHKLFEEHAKRMREIHERPIRNEE